MRILNSKTLEKELMARGLVPDGCRLVEVSITPNSALVVRYEVFIDADRLDRFADALKAAADEAKPKTSPSHISDLKDTG